MPIIHIYTSAPYIQAPRLQKTNSPLEALDSWTSSAFRTEGYKDIAGAVFSDVVGALYIEQSDDKVNWDISELYNIPGNDGKGFVERLLLSYVRVRYVNNIEPQTAFRLSFNFR